MVRATSNLVQSGWSTNVTHNYNLKRGVHDKLDMVEKNWAASYDIYICLKDGEYEVIYKYLRDTTVGNASAAAYINGVIANIDYTEDASHRSGLLIFTHHFKRNDYLYLTGSSWSGSSSHLLIHRMD